jgi:hypothetical protein
MKNTIVFDLDDTLISSRYNLCHPQAKEILTRSNNDFKNIYLWTHHFKEKAIKDLNKYNLFQYFNGIIYMDINVDKETNESNGIFMLTKYNNGNGESYKSLELTHQKNLTQLGDPKKYILIENRTSMGYPLERVIEIDPLTQNYTPCLNKAYEKALKKF